MIGLIEFYAMGCQVSVQLETDEHNIDMLAHIPDEVAAIEACLTRFRPDSELMQLNEHAGEWVAVSDTLFANVQVAKQGALMTDGLYHPLVLPAMVANGYDRSFAQIQTSDFQQAIPAPDWRGIKFDRSKQHIQIPARSALDLGGIAKGWTAQYLAEKLSHYGACLVNMGGDIVGRGAPQGSDGWVVAIQDPFTGDDFALVTLVNQSIVSSGIDYRKWQDQHGKTHHHLINPTTGESAHSDALSVTVIHPDGATAEAYAKAVLLRGSEAGIAWLNHQWHSAGLVFRRDGAVIASSRFTDIIQERNLVS